MVFCREVNRVGSRSVTFTTCISTFLFAQLNLPGIIDVLLQVQNRIFVILLILHLNYSKSQVHLVPRSPLGLHNGYKDNPVNLPLIMVRDSLPFVLLPIQFSPSELILNLQSETPQKPFKFISTCLSSTFRVYIKSKFTLEKFNRSKNTSFFSGSFHFCLFVFFCSIYFRSRFMTLFIIYLDFQTVFL